MLVEQLIEVLKQMPQESVAVCKGTDGGWDNIKGVRVDGSSVSIIFGGGSPFSNGG